MAAVRLVLASLFCLALLLAPPAGDGRALAAGNENVGKQIEQIILNGESNIGSLEDDRLTDFEREDYSEYGFRSTVSVPLVSNDQVVGIDHIAFFKHDLIYFSSRVGSDCGFHFHGFYHEQGLVLFNLVSRFHLDI